MGLRGGAASRCCRAAKGRGDWVADRQKGKCAVMQTGKSERIERELLAITHENLRPMLVMNFLACGGVSLILWSDGAHWVVAWFAAAALLGTLRYASSVGRSHAAILCATPGRVARWRHQFAIGLYLSAALWAGLSLLLNA